MSLDAPGGGTGSGFHGFDTPQIRTMASNMKTISPQSRTMHGELARLLMEVQGLMDGKPAVVSPSLQPLVGQVLPAFYHGLPGSLHQELDDTSASLGRRCDQLDTVQGLGLVGISVDPALDFSDEAPPDRTKIDNALEYFDDHIDDSGGFLWANSAQGAGEVYDDFAKLTPTELDAVMSQMSDDQLRKLNSQLGEGSSWWGGGDADGGVQQKWENMLLSECGPETLTRLQAQLTNLPWEPDPKTDSVKDARYEPVDLPLFAPDGSAPDVTADISMGRVGDCWFMASLAAVTEQDPDFPREHIRQNPNGTYTVTLYDKSGKPVEVTVDNKMPRNDDGLVYAEPSSNVLWPLIYEKALAQYKGGYGNIEGGFGDQSMDILTGQDAERHNPKDVSLADIDDRLSKGEAVTIGSNSKADKNDTRMVSDHEYTVRSVNMNSHPPTVEVMNPWGADGSKDHLVTLTEDQYRKLCDEVSFTPEVV
ncbi:C2 family cysteine protease [Streptomyces sp. NRRL F-5123]|uniref:C2 family cysteine protease n=1 Tax=Streptomyces sp. NRRL F-5123 TaxID=1463856 RepID=UPI0004E1C062|nr:C2 family cysteine protease [Streptomyces sp. NRRL F-5123]